MHEAPFTAGPLPSFDRPEGRKEPMPGLEAGRVGGGKLTDTPIVGRQGTQVFAGDGVQARGDASQAPRAGAGGDLLW